MRTEDLIARLARDAVPVTPIRRAPVRLAWWLPVALAAAAVSVAIIGPRPDLPGQMRDEFYVVSLALTAATGLLAAAAALVLGVPDDHRPRVVVVAPFVVLLGWGGLLVGRLISAPDVAGQFARTPAHPACLLQIALASLVPGALLVRQLRRAAPLHARHTGLLAALGASGIAAVGAQISCPIDAAAHLLPWHLGAVAALTLVSLLWAKPALGRVAA